MKKNEIQLTKDFKIQAAKAIFAITVFILSYLIILLLAFLLTGLCIAGGLALIAIKPMFITLALGAGLASLGFLIIIFLLKFIFKSHKTDRSGLIEIHATQEPELFKMIHELVREVGTHFPKKVYVSAEVNASVFYDSSFWSMFLPVRKNLVIGVGLVNTVTKEELKAILAHEFGHFSQRTMKVGSYVYNVNQVIFNMLYDNESYDNLVQKWADASGYFSIFVAIALKINEGIQWILKQLYEVVNKSYMGLSREMEFHADEIAASVTGYLPLKKSLLRLNLADYAWNDVLRFYSENISDNVKSENLYKDQSAVLRYVAEANHLSLTNQLPDVPLEEQSKYDKSKLVIKDQWASHPSTKDRIRRLEKTGFNNTNSHDMPGNDLFKDIEGLQKRLTQKIFEDVNYEGNIKHLPTHAFIEAYTRNLQVNSFPKLYNGYYDHKNPTRFHLPATTPPTVTLRFEDLFSDEKVDWVYTAIALQNDIATLKNIHEQSIPVKTFDYDGLKYKSTAAQTLAEKLQSELDTLLEKINNNDLNIYHYFLGEESAQNQTPQLQNIYTQFFAFDEAFDSKYTYYTHLINALQFVNETTPFEEITTNFKNIQPLEENLKRAIRWLLSDEILQPEILPATKENLEKYTGNTWTYFDGTSYFEDNLKILFDAAHQYSFLLTRKYFLTKKHLLTYQEALLKNRH